MSDFDPTKPVICKDGTKARIICTDRHSVGTEPQIVALLQDNGTTETPRCFLQNGESLNPAMYADLMNGLAILEARIYQNIKTGEWRVSVRNGDSPQGNKTWRFMGSHDLVVPAPDSED